MGRITWEDVAPEDNGGCKTRTRWILKPNKTDQGGENHFEKTFMVNEDRSAISASFSISSLFHKREYRNDWDHLSIPLFLDPDTGKEITIARSRKMLAMKAQEAGLSLYHIKGHSLRIGGATEYANTPEGCSITASFLDLRVSRAGCSYMHAYWSPLELAGLAVERESGVELAVRPGPVGTYAQGKDPSYGRWESRPRARRYSYEQRNRRCADIERTQGPQGCLR